MDVYFLVMATRRVLMFATLLKARVSDARLEAALDKFNRTAPDLKRLRDLYEHLDEYLLDSPDKHVKFVGKAAPVLLTTWDTDNVVVSFGPLEVDVIIAGLAAIELGETAAEIWEERRVAWLDSDPPATPPDDGKLRFFEVQLGVSTVIGRDGETQVNTGTLRDTRVRDATATEIEEHAAEPPNQMDTSSS